MMLPEHDVAIIVLTCAEAGAALAEEVAPDRAVYEFAGMPFSTDFVRDDAGAAKWARFSGRLAPRKA